MLAPVDYKALYLGIVKVVVSHWGEVQHRGPDSVSLHPDRFLLWDQRECSHLAIGSRSRNRSLGWYVTLLSPY